jgi:hypothetical protein
VKTTPLKLLKLDILPEIRTHDHATTASSATALLSLLPDKLQNDIAILKQDNQLALDQVPILRISISAEKKFRINFNPQILDKRASKNSRYKLI